MTTKALAPAVQGDRHSPQVITWEKQNLTGATVTAVKQNLSTRAVTAVTGTITVTSSTSEESVFSWAYSEADTGTAGRFVVQFRASYGAQADATMRASWYVEPLLAATTVAAPPLVGIGPDAAAWLDAATPGGALGTAAYAATGDFEAAGAAAAVAGDLTTHEGLTGAGVHGAGATGAAVLGAASVDAARATLGIASINQLPMQEMFHAMDWSTSNLTGSGSAGQTARAYVQVASGSTADSTASFRVNANTDALYFGDATSFNWSKPVRFGVRLGFATDNAEGVCYVIFGKAFAAAYGLVASGNYVALEFNSRALVNLHVCKAGVLSAAAVVGFSDERDKNITITHDNGQTAVFVNGVIAAQTNDGPVVASTGLVFAEANNGATAAGYTVRLKIWGEV